MTRIEWEEMEPGSEPPPAPKPCEAGPESHVWLFTYDAFDGATLVTRECEACNAIAQHGDWPSEYLVLHDLPVRLSTHIERYGWETPEYDVWVNMTPVQQDAENLEDHKVFDH